MNDHAIEVRDVRKRFRLYYDKGHTLKEKVLYKSRNQYDVREVLKGISFDVKKGEAVGLIGNNGCGKSTTLKLLTRIMYPDSGSIRIHGRVSSLLELGAGFHPDMSGRENIFINASIFGLTRKEIEGRLPDIVAFSELGQFIDNPVRTYSSGMYMRLAFSVAINVNADILLIDEILAVGDVNFQAKCFHKMMEIKNKGTTIVLVSHAMEQIEKMCDKSIWLCDGRVRMEGTSREVGREYLTYMGAMRRSIVEDELDQKNGQLQSEGREAAKEDLADAQDAAEDGADVLDTAAEDGADAPNGQETKEERLGSGEARFKSVRSRNAQGKETYAFAHGEQIRFEMEYTVYQEIENVAFGLSIFRIDGVRCYGTNTLVDELPLFHLVKDGKVSIIFDCVRLLPGKYYVDVCIEKNVGDYADYWDSINEFEIISDERDIGVIRMPHAWER